MCSVQTLLKLSFAVYVQCTYITRHSYARDARCFQNSDYKYSKRFQLIDDDLTHISIIKKRENYETKKNILHWHSINLLYY